MLSRVLGSQKEKEVNIVIMREFIQLRKISSVHRELFERIEKLENGFDSLNDLLNALFIQEHKPKISIVFLY
jgi:hypothetical protein